jgi:hypothetical protein
MVHNLAFFALPLHLLYQNYFYHINISRVIYRIATIVI